MGIDLQCRSRSPGLIIIGWRLRCARDQSTDVPEVQLSVAPVTEQRYEGRTIKIVLPVQAELIQVRPGGFTPAVLATDTPPVNRPQGTKATFTPLQLNSPTYIRGSDAVH